MSYVYSLPLFLWSFVWTLTLPSDEFILLNPESETTLNCWSYRQQVSQAVNPITLPDSPSSFNKIILPVKNCTFLHDVGLILSPNGCRGGLDIRLLSSVRARTCLGTRAVMEVLSQGSTCSHHYPKWPVSDTDRCSCPAWVTQTAAGLGPPQWRNRSERLRPADTHQSRWVGQNLEKQHQTGLDCSSECPGALMLTCTEWQHHTRMWLWPLQHKISIDLLWHRQNK